MPPDTGGSEYPIHWLTRKPMAPCPTCGRLSGLSGIDGGNCLSCSGGYPPEEIEIDQSVVRKSGAASTNG